MKKIIIAAAIACVAAFAQAGTVTWGSGAMYTAASASGGWSSTTVMSAGALVTMNVFLVDAATYTSISGMSQADLYAWTDGKTADYTAKNLSATDSTIAAVTAKKSDAAASTTYYAVLTAEYTDATYGDMYMAVAKESTTSGTGIANVANIFGGASTASVGGVRDWQAAAVPEPTSGLLLLLGVAGLALRRKQK